MQMAESNGSRLENKMNVLTCIWFAIAHNSNKYCQLTIGHYQFSAERMAGGWFFVVVIVVVVIVVVHTKRIHRGLSADVVTQKAKKIYMDVSNSK